MSQIVYYCREVKFDVSSCVVKNLHISEPKKKCQIAYLLGVEIESCWRATFSILPKKIKIRSGFWKLLETPGVPKLLSQSSIFGKTGKTNLQQLSTPPLNLLALEKTDPHEWKYMRVHDVPI